MPESSTTASLAPVRPPRQSRSQKTLARLLDATEEMLRERPFEAITVAQIVAAAGTSVGAFYARFRDKDALLPALYQRYDDWLAGRNAQLETQRSWAGQGLGGVAAWLASELVGFFAQRRHLIRALALHARLRPEKIDAETRARRVQQTGFLRDALLSCRDEIAHPEPERAVELAIFMAASTCREWILFREAPHAQATGGTSDELEREVAHMVASYLSAGSGPAQGPSV